MIINNIRLALRRLYRQKLHAFLHVAGLSLGMSVCLLIGLFLRHELSFDRYHVKAGRTYRVNQIWTDLGEKSPHFSTPYSLAEALRTEIPELETVAKVHPDYEPIVEINPQKRFEQDNVMFAEPEFLDIFDIQMLEGNGHEALRHPFQALLTETAAEKFFGREDPLGKTFTYNRNYTFTVAGLIRDLPENTHLPFSMLLSFVADDGLIESSTHPQWGMVSGGSTFVVLPENLAPASLDARLKAICDKNINTLEGLPEGTRCDMQLQPLRNVHLEPEWAGGGEWVKAVDPLWLWFFGSVGLAVLALACINFINLSTAKALDRAREVGVRKSVGAGIRQLIGQFVGEAMLLAFISGMLAVTIAWLSLPALNDLAAAKIGFDLFQSAGLAGALLAGIALTGLLAGLYPAWVIARFRPAATLKTSWTAGNRGSAMLRKGLVVMQFTVSVSLLVALMVIALQMNFLRGKNLGFEKDNIVVVPVPKPGKQTRFRAELAQIAQIKDVSFSTNSPSADGHWGTAVSLKDGNDPARKDVTLLMADDHFCSLYGLQLKAGRLLEASDTSAVTASTPEGQRFPKAVVNEKLVRALGFASPEAALNRRIWIGMNGWNPEIVGVVADFNTGSLHEDIKPALITQFARTYRKAGIKIEADSDIPQTLAAVESAWKKTFPDQIYEFEFLDQIVDSYYKSEARLFSLFKLFAGIAMFISCLGLWGLATYAAEHRRKEIGIRKVLGASASGIVALLSREFLLLVAISFAIATPLAWFGMNKWLADFAFRIELHWWVFAVAGLAAMIVAFFTVGSQGLKAALANPVNTLKSE